MILEESLRNIETNHECVVCLNILRPTDDKTGSTECRKCRVVVCKPCAKKFSKEKICPHCRSTQGFKKNISIQLREELKSLQFKCQSCSIILLFEDAEKHVQDSSVCVQIKKLNKSIEEHERFPIPDHRNQQKQRENEKQLL